MNDSWRIFYWASLHSPEFQLCYIELPIELTFRTWRSQHSHIASFSISIVLQPLRVFFPYSVKQAYWTSKGQQLDQFDDIPF